MEPVGIITVGQSKRNILHGGSVMLMRAFRKICLGVIFLVCSVNEVPATEQESYVNGIPCGGYAAEVGVGLKCAELTLFFDL